MSLRRGRTFTFHNLGQDWWKHFIRQANPSWSALTYDATSESFRDPRKKSFSHVLVSTSFSLAFPRTLRIFGSDLCYVLRSRLIENEDPWSETLAKPSFAVV